MAIAAVCFTGLSAPVHAADFCAAPVSDSKPLANNEFADSPTNPDDLAVVADSATLGNDGVTVLRGNVAMRRSEGVMRANELRYDQNKQLVSAKENVSFSSGELDVKSSAAAVDLLANTAQFSNAEFSVSTSNARGSAEQIELAGDGSPDMRGVRYTTCPPGNESWVLKADRIRLDQETGQGRANNMSLYFKGVPILYLPYMQFPFTDQRQSGLLAPSFGSSDSNGIEFGIPYYWNIAPNADATFTPSFLSRRGWRLDSEVRGITGTPLSQRSDQTWWQANGSLNVNWLPDDAVTNTTRYLANGQANAVGKGKRHFWQWKNQLIDVNDSAWFDDFGSSLADVSQPFFVSRSLASWQYGDNRNHVRVVAVAENHEPLIGSTTTLISRQPELSFDARQQLGSSPFSFGLKTQTGRFSQQGSDTTVGRSHYQPWVSFDLQRDGWWLKSAAHYLNTRWTSTTPGSTPQTAQRSLPVYTSEFGLHLEKAYEGGHHVIEPTLSYRAAPYRDQTAVPVLDTHTETLYWHNLNDDQFSGLDRIRDGSQVSATIASRWYDFSGEQRLGFRLGQLWYLGDTQVTLPGETAAGDRSNTLFELTAALGQRWSVSTYGEWDSQMGEIEHSQLRVDLKDPELGDFYISLRQRRDLFRQASIGGKRQISSQWHIDASGLYSLDDTDLLEANVKLRYQTCCWAIDFGGKRVLRDASGEPDIGFFIQLELTGLAQIGTQ